MPGNARDPLELAIEARDISEGLLGEGQTTFYLVRDERNEITVRLAPADFQVNAIHSGNQHIGSGRGARQLAAAENTGTAIACWNAPCANGRCSIFARRFDHSGLPLVNGSTDDDREFMININEQSFNDRSAIAAQADGTFLVTWQNKAASTSSSAIVARAFSADGSARTSTPQTIQISRNVDDVANASVSALTGGYMIVWSEKSDSSVHIRGQLVDVDGHYDASVPNFDLATLGPQNETDEVQPAIASGPNNEFMVAWIDRGNVVARIFDSSGTPSSTSLSPGQAQTGRAQHVDLASIQDGYAIVWDDELGAEPDLDGRSIQFRRISRSGASMDERAVTLNTRVAADQSQPAIAGATDGTLLVVWKSDDQILDANSGIRGRVLRSSGMPVGPDFRINTTRAGSQGNPSAVSLGQAEGMHAFMILFEDGSLAGPDREEAGMRARIIYPELNPTTGAIGSSCSERGECDNGFICARTADSERRCFESCASGASICRHGGSCQQTTTVNTPICLF